MNVKKAEEVLSNKQLYDNNIYQTKRLLIKYYHTIGLTELECRKSLIEFLKSDEFILQGGQKYNMTDDMDSIYSMCRAAYNEVSKKSFHLTEKNHVEIYQSELDKISNLKNMPMERISFVLLVLQKIINLNEAKFTEWVNFELKNFYGYSRNEIRNSDAPYKMMYKLRQNGIIDVADIKCGGDNDSLKLLIIESEGDIAIEVSDIEDCVDKYIEWKSKMDDCCDMCGMFITNKNPRQKYCKKCWKVRQKEINRKAVEKHRNKG